MFRTTVASLAISAAFLCPGAGRAEEITLDYKTTLTLAAERTLAVVAARGRVGEAKGKRAGAAVRLPTNPDLEVIAGPRFRGDESTTDLAIGLRQTFELGGRRGARLAAADAGVAQAQSGADDTLRLALRAAALAYYRSLAASERFRLAGGVESIAADIVAATERRLARGDAVELEVNLARTALGRARAAVRAAEADREAALAELRALTGLDPADEIVVTGDLSARPAYKLDDLLAAARRRPDLGLLDEQRDEGAALVRLGGGYAWPDVGFGVGYAREEGADILLGGLTITLPFFERGQEHRQTGRAKIARATSEKAGLWRSIEAELRGGFAAHEKRVAAVETFEKDVLPLLDENDRLLTKSYDQGQITLADYLVARRELLDARSEYLQRLLELAEASVELEATAGVLR